MKCFAHILTGIGFLLAIGCGEKIRDVSSESEYAPIIGKVYTTKMDLLLVKYFASKKEYNFAFTDRLSIAGIKRPVQFPMELDNLTVYGIVPKGTRFEVKKINSVKSIEFSMVDFHVEILSPGQFNGYKVNAVHLTNSLGVKGVTLDPKYVDEFARASKPTGE